MNDRGHFKGSQQVFIGDLALCKMWFVLGSTLVDKITEPWERKPVSGGGWGGGLVVR